MTQEEWREECYQALEAKHIKLKADHAQLVALVKDAVTKWRSQTNAQEGLSFKLAMKTLETAVGEKGMDGAQCANLVALVKEWQDSYWDYINVTEDAPGSADIAKRYYQATTALLSWH